MLSYPVGRRVREIGVRMALGAQIRDVLRLVVVEGMRPTLLGIVLGLGAALALGRALASLFYGVSVADPSCSEPWPPGLGNNRAPASWASRRSWPRTR